MVRKNNILWRTVAAAVCVAMVVALIFAFPPMRADAATASPKTVEVPGVGTVAYLIVSDSDLAYDPDEWTHAHVSYGGSSKDFRVVKSARLGNIVYYVDETKDGVNLGTLPAVQSGGITSDPLDFELYGASKISFLDFWKGEGLTQSALTDASSPVEDPEGYTDLGGFDSVVRATLTYGVGHSAYANYGAAYGSKAYLNTEYDASGTAISSYELEEDPVTGDPIPGGPFYPTFTATKFSGSSYTSVGAPKFWLSTEKTTGAGHAASLAFLINQDNDGDADNDQAYVLNHYDIQGFANMPVSVNAVDYVENYIAADAGKEIPIAFTNFKYGGGLVNLWDEASDTNARTVPVDEDTGLLKHIDPNGNYGPAQDGKSEMTYEVVSNGGKDTIGVAYDTQWGDYFDAYVYLQSSDSSKTTADLSNERYFNYAYNFIGAKYEYYGDVEDIPGITDESDIGDLSDLGKYVNLDSSKAAYGTNHMADTWWAPSKKPRIELGFNFDAIRLGGNGADTTPRAEGETGVFQQGAARDNAGFYKVTLYALGHENIEKLVYVPARYFLLSEDSLSLNTGLSQTLTTSSKNLALDLTDAVTETITWKSSNPQVASVDQSGKVTALAAGTATITALNKVTDMKVGRGGVDPVETEIGVFPATAKVTVTNPPADTPPADTPLADTPPVDTPPVDTPPVDTPPVDTPPVDTPPVDTPPVDTPPANTPSVITPPADNPASGNPTDGAPSVTASIKLNASKATLYHKGSKSKLTLKATVTGASGSVTWKSSNAKVATVSYKGVVTAKAKGTATITATANGVTATTLITVKNATLTLKKAKATIRKGKTYSIKAAATPKATISYKTSDKKIATVSAKGVVKGKKKGTAAITVTANGIARKFKVTVK